MNIGPRSKTLGEISYNDACLLMISFHLLDMLSTDIVLYHGQSAASETNTIAAAAHGGPWVILFRIIPILVTYTCLKAAKFNPYELKMLSQFSSLKILMGKKLGLSFATQIKFGIILIFSMISFTRLLAAISNISGELFGFSMTIFVERYVGVESLRSIGTVSVILLSMISIFVICVLWDYFRREKFPQRPDQQISEAV